MTNETQINENATGLRFAALVRVSTEEQSRKGESLKNQKKRLEDCVNFLQGVIVRWYEGQEHSSAGYERKILDELLFDSEKNLFDAVIVYDISRWSRDLITSINGLKKLQKNNIRFFVDEREHDFNSPDAELIINITASTAEWQAKVSRKKSIENRIARAKRGWPCGNLPFGRRLVGTDRSGYIQGQKRSRKINIDNKHGDAQWEIIPEDKLLVDRLYEMYVNQGIGLDKIGAYTGIKSTRIRDILVNKCGSEWIQSFDGHDISTTIPPLLTLEQIAAVKHRAKNNRQFRTIIHEYPLSHYVKCGICGDTLTNQTTQEKNENNYRRYIHLTKNKTPNCVRTLRGKVLDDMVFAQIGQMLKNTENLKTAIQQVLDRSVERKTTIFSEIESAKKRLKELNTENERVVHLFRKGFIENEDAENHLSDIKSQKNVLEDRINALQYEKLSMETDLSSEALEAIIKQYCSALTGLNGYAPATWSVEDKKKLAKFFFGTKNKSLGVFVKVEQHPEMGKCFSYLIRGMLGTAIGAVGKESFEGLADMAEENPSGAVLWDAQEQIRLARQFFGTESEHDDSKAKEFPTGEVNISDLKELVNNLDEQQMSGYSRPRKKSCEIGLLSSTVT